MFDNDFLFLSFVLQLSTNMPFSEIYKLLHWYKDLEKEEITKLLMTLLHDTRMIFHLSFPFNKNRIVRTQRSNGKVISKSVGNLFPSDDLMRILA